MLFQRSAITCFLLLIFAAFQPLSLSAQPFNIATLKERMEASQIVWGGYAVDADSGQILFALNAHKLFIPASLTKLFTAAVALDTLGPEYTFTTSVNVSEPPDEQGHVFGHLYLRGTGDPSLDTAQLKRLAQAVFDKGIRRITGQLLVDNGGIYTPLPTHAEWQDLTAAYAAEVSPLNINENLVKVRVNPHPAGLGPAQVQIEQENDYCQLRNYASTCPETKEPQLDAQRGLTDNLIELKGKIPAQADTYTLTVAIHQPAAYALKIFQQELQKRGIVLKGQAIARHASPLYEIARVSSPPLKVLMAHMHKTSHNLTAEMLFRAIGHFQSNAQANRVEDNLQQACHRSAEFLEQCGLKPETYQLHDGAGLSRHNLLTPEQVVRLLAFVKNSPYASIFIDTLAVPGEKGTLLKRFVEKGRSYQIKAKSGSMSGISNLAGFATSASGKNLLFALFANHSPESWEKTTAQLDATLETLLQGL